MIHAEGDDFFVIDQGSTNGSFINEERLIPGRKTEFTSFFPVRLGDNVLITLISDEEGSPTIDIPVPSKEKTSPHLQQKTSDKTSVVSLKELSKVKTETLIQKRATAGKNKTTQKKVEKKKANFMPYAAFMILIAAAVYNYIQMKEEKVVDEPVSEVGKVITNPELTNPSVPKESDDLLPVSEMVPKDIYSTLINDIKCTTDVEIYLCDLFPGAREPGYGVAQVGLTLHVMVEGTPYMEETKSYLNFPPQIDDSFKELQLDTAAYIYLLKVAEKPEIDISNFPDSKISVAFFRTNAEGDKEVFRQITFKSSVLTKLKDFVSMNNLQLIRTSGNSALLITKDKYRTY